jgi:hypothetical protein
MEESATKSPKVTTLLTNTHSCSVLVVKGQTVPKLDAKPVLALTSMDVSTQETSRLARPLSGQLAVTSALNARLERSAQVL